MSRIPRRYSHFVYGVIQSGLTCAIATAIANVRFAAHGSFMNHWLQSWFVAWILMLPVVLFAAPAIRNLTDLLTDEE
jgi:FtsH-binding integral membrane protein